MGHIMVAGPGSVWLPLKESRSSSSLSEGNYERNMDAKLHSQMERHCKRSKIDTNSVLFFLIPVISSRTGCWSVVCVCSYV